MSFDDAFARLIDSEGGYVNDPHDPGGETKFGISKRSYPDVDIKNLTREGARLIYLRDFWTGGQMNQFAFAIAFQVFDAAVNHGIRRAIKLLQAAAGVKQDGNIGSVTIAAVKAMREADCLALFIAARLDFWRGLATWPSFGAGWAGRTVADIRYAVIDYNRENAP